MSVCHLGSKFTRLLNAMNRAEIPIDKVRRIVLGIRMGGE